MSALALTRHRFTVADFHRLGDAGVLTPDSRVELIEGELFDMAPIGSRHAGIVYYLNSLIAPAVSGRAVVGAQNPLVLDERTEVYPDILVLKPRADFYRNAHPRPDDVLLLIEVADSTIRSDRRVKLPLYARHGVAEVWLIDMTQACVEVCRGSGPAGYAERTVHHDGSVSPMALPDIVVDVATLF